MKREAEESEEEYYEEDGVLADEEEESDESEIKYEITKNSRKSGGYNMRNNKRRSGK